MTNLKHHPKPSATETQRARALYALRAAPQTFYYLRRRGICQSPTRVFELRNQGYKITKTPVQIVDVDGFIHFEVAPYTLIAESTEKDNCGSGS